MAASASGVAAAAALGPAEGPCVLCCGELEVVALGRCDHPICYRCSVRMRALCGVRYCAVCREELGQVRPRRGRGGGERGQARGEASAGPCGITPRSSRSAAGGGRERKADGGAAVAALGSAARVLTRRCPSVPFCCWALVAPRAAGSRAQRVATRRGWGPGSAAGLGLEKLRSGMALRTGPRGAMRGRTNAVRGEELLLCWARDHSEVVREMK